MIRRLLSAAGPALALLLALARCTPELEDVSTRCDALSECALGQLCDLTEHRCITPSTDRMLGRFQCVVAERQDGRTDYPPDGASEVTGLLEQRPVNLLKSARCRLVGDDLSLVFFGVTANSTYPLLELTVHGGRSLASGAVAELPQSAGVLNRGIVSGVAGVSNTFVRFGATLAGRLQLTGSLAEGQSIEGYLDVPLTPACDVGAPQCPDGLSCLDPYTEGPGLCLQPVDDGACGAALGRYCPQGQVCLLAAAGDEAGTCVARCDANTPCTGGLSCSYELADKTRGVCKKLSGRHQSCDDPQTGCQPGDQCLEGSSGKKYCAGPTCTLGQDACGEAGERCLGAGDPGDPGVCDKPVPVLGTCSGPRWLLCDKGHFCLRPSPEVLDGYCTRACAQDADCPAGHPCTTELPDGSTVCTL